MNLVFKRRTRKLAIFAKLCSLLFVFLFLAACRGQDVTPVDLGKAAVGAVVAPDAATAVPEPSSTMVPTTDSSAKVTETASSTPLPPTRLPPASPTLAPPASPTLAPPTATEQPQLLSFAVIGDYGTTGVGSQEVADLVNRWDPDLVLTVGDNNYPDGAAGTIAGNITQHYGRFIDEARFFPTLGNHDMTTGIGRPYLDYFELPGNERYYDFVRGDVHFLAINSDWREPDGIGASSRQAEWLREVMAGSTSAWQVVYFHAAPYVSMEAKEVPVMRWPFAQWGADLVLSGHAHLYERLSIDNIPYLVNGLGGGGIYAFDAETAAGSQARFNDDYGALLVEVSENQLTARFITRANVVIDEMVLRR